MLVEGRSPLRSSDDRGPGSDDAAIGRRRGRWCTTPVWLAAPRLHEALGDALGGHRTVQVEALMRPSRASLRGFAAAAASGSALRRPGSFEAYGQIVRPLVRR